MRATGWLLILVCAGSLRVGAQESDEAGVKARILAQEQAWFEANSSGDTRRLNQIFDNALVYVEDGRLMTKGDYLSRLRLAGSHGPQIVAEAKTVRIFGNAAIVVGTYHEISVRDGKTLLRRWRFIDTWVSKNGSWILVAAGASPVS